MPYRELATIYYGNHKEHGGKMQKSFKVKPSSTHTKHKITLTSASNTKSLLNVSDSNMIWEKTIPTTPTGVSTSNLVTEIYSRYKGCQLGQIIRGVFKFHATTWLTL